MEVTCQRQWEEREESILHYESLKIYNIRGKSGLWVRMHCLPIPFNYRAHEFPRFAYTTSKVPCFGVLVWFCSATLPEAWEHSQFHVRSPTEHSHTCSCPLWSPFPLITHFQGEAVKTSRPRAREQQQSRRPSSEAHEVSSRSAFLGEHHQGQENYMRPPTGSWQLPRGREWGETCGDSFSSTCNQERFRHNHPEKLCRGNSVLASQSLQPPACTEPTSGLKVWGVTGYFS